MHGTIEITKRPQTRFAYVFVESGIHVRCIGTNHYGDCGLNHLNQWAWIVGLMVNEFGCDPDAVHCEEGEDGEEFITIDGKRVGRVEIE